MGCQKLIYLECMKYEKLYRIAESRHGNLHRDVVHDMYLKFGSELPIDQYVVKCVQHHKPDPLQQKWEIDVMDEDQEDEVDFSLMLGKASRAVNNVRLKYEEEVDTFLACHVHGTYKSFGELSGISRTVLEKICKFAQYEILREFTRIEKLG